MSQEQLEACLAHDLVRIHQVITRGIAVSRQALDRAAAEGFADEEQREGLANFIDSLITVLDSHHSAEESIFFPPLRDRLPDCPFDRLGEEHHLMEPLIEEARVAVNDVRSGEHLQESLAALKNILDQLNEIWAPHIATEEQHFSRASVDEILAIEEQEGLLQQIGMHNQQHGQPDYLIVPFTLMNLEPDQRRIFARHMPPMVLDELLPIAWRSQWRSMAPFLIP